MQYGAKKVCITTEYEEELIRKFFEGKEELVEQLLPQEKIQECWEEASQDVLLKYQRELLCYQGRIKGRFVCETITWDLLDKEIECAYFISLLLFHEPNKTIKEIFECIIENPEQFYEQMEYNFFDEFEENVNNVIKVLRENTEIKDKLSYEEN